MTRRSVRFFIALAALVLPLALGGPALAAPNFADDDCGNADSVIDTVPETDRVKNGYNCPTVALTIAISLLNITEPFLPITAASVKIIGPDPASASGRVEIINNVAGSDVFIIAQTGNIEFDEASIKAHHLLKLECKGLVPLCKILGEDSDVIAATSFVTPTSGGDLKILSRGDTDIRRSTVHGGDRLEMSSAQGSLTLLCQPGVGGCKDPQTVPGLIAALCPAGFPCQPIFNSPDDITAVCIQAPGVVCNGGAVEKRFEAKFDIDITGSKIDSIEHMTFESSEGCIKASGAQLTSTTDNIRIAAKKCVTSPVIDLSKATVLTPIGQTIIIANPGCPAPPTVCIDMREAEVEGANITVTAKAPGANGVIDLCGATINDLGADFPTFNADSTPPYDNAGSNVLDTECPGAPNTPTGPPNIS